MSNREHYFATDMMHFVSNMYNIDWVPREEQNTPSPFTVLNKTGINAYLKEWENTMLSIYQLIRGSSWERDFRGFIQCVVDPRSLLLLKHLFLACFHVARYATLFYMNGVLDAPDVGIEIIERSLREAAKHKEDDIFRIFELYCLDLPISER